MALRRDGALLGLVGCGGRFEKNTRKIRLVDWDVQDTRYRRRWYEFYLLSGTNDLRRATILLDKYTLRTAVIASKCGTFSDGNAGQSSPERPPKHTTCCARKRTWRIVQGIDRRGVTMRLPAHNTPRFLAATNNTTSVRKRCRSRQLRIIISSTLHSGRRKLTSPLPFSIKKTCHCRRRCSGSTEFSPRGSQNRRSRPLATLSGDPRAPNWHPQRLSI